MGRWRLRRRELLNSVVAVVLFMVAAGGDEMAMSPEKNRQTAATTRMVIDRFNEAFNRHDADAAAALLTDDTVFEDTSPAPDGKRVKGKAAVVEFWRGWFAR